MHDEIADIYQSMMKKFISRSHTCILIAALSTLIPGILGLKILCLVVLVAIITLLATGLDAVFDTLHHENKMLREELHRE